jgi:Domain of unknown function (DUF4157)
VKATLQRRCACGGTPGPDGECAACKAKRLQRRRSKSEPAVAPPIVHDVLRETGRPLEPRVRGEMESRLGHDFSRVRVHTDARAAESARAVGALAYTVGRNVVFDRGRFAPASSQGRALLLHELSHVVQQRAADSWSAHLPVEPSSGAVEREATSIASSAAAGASVATRAAPAAPRLQRFTTGERGEIRDLDTVVSTAQRIAAERGAAGMMRWGRFVAGASAFGALEAVGSTSSRTSTLPARYVFTCRCGLVDMRHFYQMMYIALIQGNRPATEAGREHELTAEETSRFAPEDTPSNALGALFGEEQSWFERQSTFVSELRRFLSLCRPVDFTALSPADQNTIVDYYSARGPSGAPLHQAQSAIPAHLTIAGCAGLTGMFPFVFAGPDIEWKTLSGEVEPR